jgi:hypothetical protein
LPQRVMQGGVVEAAQIAAEPYERLVELRHAELVSKPLRDGPMRQEILIKLLKCALW